MKEIKNIEHVVASDTKKFTRIVKSLTETWQSEGLQVDIQYGAICLNGPIGAMPQYTALVIGYKLNPVNETINYNPIGIRYTKDGPVFDDENDGIYRPDNNSGRYHPPHSWH